MKTLQGLTPFEYWLRRARALALARLVKCTPPPGQNLSTVDQSLPYGALRCRLEQEPSTLSALMQALNCCWGKTRYR
ncbi:hypothetical protein DA792_00715 (plasmid) [Celeribacter baekdonensis]|uniref:Uncharacterized protein n=1 Tax=Celeribacter baekdonensis TaxID=875171 RepID=A0A2R4LY12_9RHOB|nr:hypothetical protein DA792_00715 [Celeribacter baekdonensis]